MSMLSRDGSAQRLLVVDDNASAREILLAMARTFGLRADCVPDGRQALSGSRHWVARRFTAPVTWKSSR